MSDTGCSQEFAVVRAVRSGAWDHALEAHVRECPACNGVRDAALWMQTLAAGAEPALLAQGDLPDPRILWLRAQVEARHAAAEQAQKMAQWVEIACTVFVCIAAALWVAWNWGAVAGAINQAVNWMALQASPALWSVLYAYGPVNAPVLFSLAVMAAAAVVMGVSYPLLLRE